MMNNMIKTLFGEKTNFSIEVISGFTTFLTMAYIILVNADILSVTGMDKTALIAVTCLVTGIVTIICGIYRTLPLPWRPAWALMLILPLL